MTVITQTLSSRRAARARRQSPTCGVPLPDVLGLECVVGVDDDAILILILVFVLILVMILVLVLILMLILVPVSYTHLTLPTKA